MKTKNFLKVFSNYFLGLFLFTSFSYAQQESTIKNIKTNGGIIEVTQEGNDTSKTATIDSIVGDTFKIKIAQRDNVTKVPESNWFMKLINDTNTFVALIIALITLGGIILKGVHFLRNKRKEK